MTKRPTLSRTGTRFLSRLAKDTAGNTLMIFTGALLPLLAMLGGGIDMGRGYLAQSRLQQACDAGVLAARKRLGTDAAVTGVLPVDIAAIGQRYFNINFRNGQYGSDDRDFQMTLEDDFAISGAAEATVETTVMQVFGFTDLPISVECSAQLNMSNTDIMMVLDVTGSMAQINPDDTVTRMVAMTDTVRDFHAQMIAAAPATARLRFGFVPYSTNVNVGGLLENDWVVDEWDYQSRVSIVTGNEESTTTFQRNWRYVSGSRDGDEVLSNYPATYHPATPATPVVTYIDANENVITSGGPGTPAYYTCDTPSLTSTHVPSDTLISTTTNSFTGPPAGTETVELRQYHEDGIYYWVSQSGSTCYQMRRVYDDYTQTYEKVTQPISREIRKWRYRQIGYNVANWRAETADCIEERSTYEIDDYDNVDLTRALDLDLDLVPTSDEDTKWRPMYPGYIWARSWTSPTTGSFTTSPQTTTDEYIMPVSYGLAPCPAPSRKLAPISVTELDTYLDSLQPTGATYHDIGMIWGGRLLSPTGLFASENADVSATQPTTRHMIFLTDGETAPLDMSYSSYGLEPLDRRRWQPSSALTHTQTVEERFTFACNEVRRRNITVWVISFGTAANPVMMNCSGADRYFVADNAAELQETFTTIAQQMGELRISR